MFRLLLINSFLTDNQGELRDLGQDPKKEGGVGVAGGRGRRHRGSRGHCDTIRGTATSRGTGMRKYVIDIAELLLALLARFSDRQTSFKLGINIKEVF